MSTSHLTCDFCLGGSPSAAYLVTYFSLQTPLETITSMDGAWAACELCARLIDGNRLNVLIRRAIRVMGPRGMPQGNPIVHEHFRQLFSAILSRRSERLALDDPRVAPLQHQEGEAIGVGFYPGPDGTRHFEPIPAAPPHPLKP